jgi:hypothetical protein
MRAGVEVVGVPFSQHGTQPLQNGVMVKSWLTNEEPCQTTMRVLHYLAQVDPTYILPCSYRL